MVTLFGRHSNRLREAFTPIVVGASTMPAEHASMLIAGSLQSRAINAM